ncbi:MAG: TetR/AcrR family transcriptional regulator [Solirubrobacterales bacterium]
MPQRLTRKEQQARTRSRLMRSAEKLFSRRGLDGASIDDVARDAGFTKGAFYANFRSKEELFLAMLDERFAQRIEEIDRVMESGDEPEAQARRAGADFATYLRSDPEWERLFFEFAAYATRDARFREQLVTRYRAMRERIADAYRTRSEELGVEPPIPPDQIALMVFAMGNGFALEKLLEPDVPDELIGTMLVVLSAGLRAMSEEKAAV